MGGNLYMWCGPFQRWQKRYGVINNGQLHIYLSKDSKSLLESLYLATANVCPAANSQLEWVIEPPTKSSTYFKASQPEERRRWLKLIGSVKACIADCSVLSETEYMLPPRSDYRRTYSEPFHTEIPSFKANSTRLSSKLEATSSASSSPISSPELMNGVNQSTHPNVRTIQSLCEDLKIEVSKLQAHCMQGHEFDTIHYLQLREISYLLTDVKDTISSVTSKTTSHESLDDCNRDIAIEEDKTDESTDVSPGLEAKDTVATFFSELKVSFADVMQEALGHTKSTLLCSVHSQTFIDACINHAKFFDLFAATLFSPLRNDILSNAEKVRHELMKDIDRYDYLQLLIEDEIRRKHHMHPDSASQAVIWIMRGLRTVAKFLMIVCCRAHPVFKDTSKALGLAYQEHLSRYHNFIVQKMFSAGTRLLPSIEHLKKQVTTNKNLDVSSEVIEDSIMQQATAYSQKVMDVVQEIEKVFRCHNIDL